MAKTYEPIQTTTLTGTATSVSFTSIPQTYTDLVLVAQSTVANASYSLTCRLNSDSSSLYSGTLLYGNGTSAGSTRFTGLSFIYCTSYSNQGSTLGNSVTIFNFLNYSNTTTNKTFLVRGNAASNGTELFVNLYRSTSAISTITLYPDEPALARTTFVSGASYTLYGIKAA